jgi:hypothetical protein
MQNNSMFKGRMLLYNPDAYDQKVKVMYQKVLHQMQNNKKYISLMQSMNYAGFVYKMQKEGKFAYLHIPDIRNLERKKKLSTGAHWTDNEIKAFVENLHCVLETLLLLLVLTCLVLYSMTIKPLPFQRYLKTASTLVNENIFLTTLVIIYYACNNSAMLFCFIGCTLKGGSSS